MINGTRGVSPAAASGFVAPGKLSGGQFSVAKAPVEPLLEAAALAK